jgi:hypothetical protein
MSISVHLRTVPAAFRDGQATDFDVAFWLALI